VRQTPGGGAQPWNSTRRTNVQSMSFTHRVPLRRDLQRKMCGRVRQFARAQRTMGTALAQGDTSVQTRVNGVLSTTADVKSGPMRIPIRVHKVLRSRNIAVTHYTRTQDERRQRLLTNLGVRSVVDVGANAGQYAQTLREHGYRGHVLSLEPLQSAYDTLSEFAGKDDVWDTERIAVTAEPGKVTLHIGKNSQFTSVAPLTNEARTGATYRSEAQEVATEVAPADTLDDIVARHNLSSPLGVKIDVQGHEAAVIEGAGDTLADAVFLECEMSLRPIYQGQALFPEMLARLADLGFALALAESIWVMPSGRGYQINGIFVKEGTV
jgi:FkbM family methyltransferase